MSRRLVPARAGLLALFVAIALPAGAVRGLSEDDERARAHFVAGGAYFEDQRYTDAAREFREAYELSGRPEMLINLSRAHERAGAPIEAVKALELLLARHPQTSYRADAEARLATLRAAHPELSASPEPTPPPAPETPPEAPPAPRFWPPRLPTLLVGGAALAGALAAVGTGWAAHAKYEALDECHPACDYDGAEADKERGRRLARTSTGLTFAAVALGATTAVLWVLDSRAPRAGESADGARANDARAPRARLGVQSSGVALAAKLRIDF